MGNVPGDPDLPGAHGDMKFKQPPVGCDSPGRGCVQALIADDRHGGRIGEPGPQQAALAVVITDDDGLARGDALFGERHDQGAELGVGAVEAGLVEVARLATRRASPHHEAPVCPASGRTASPPPAALVAMNVCVTSIASARPLLVGRCPSASHRPASGWPPSFRAPLSLGMRFQQPSQLPVWPCPGCLGGVSGLVTPAYRKNLLPRGRHPRDPGRLPGTPAPKPNQPANPGQRERPGPGVPGPGRSW